MNKPSLATVLDGIAAVTRAEMLRDFRPDCCIATTRTVIRVLRHFGYDAQPVEVRVAIWNKSYADAIVAGTARYDGDPGWREWMDACGAWGVGLGFPDHGATGYVGHLIAFLPGQEKFIDASLDQASRPAKAIELPTTLIQPMPNSFAKTPGERLEFWSADGCTMVYERISNPTWRQSRDWSDASRTKRAMKAIICHIEASR